MNRVEAVGAAVTVAAFLGFLGLLFVSAGMWFDLRSLSVRDSKVGHPVQIVYDREFYRDFDGAWRVLLWRNERGQWASYCEASGAWGYKQGRPDQEKDLEWLVDGDERCANLPVGIYMAEVKLTANPGSFISRSDTVASNSFEVRP